MAPEVGTTLFDPFLGREVVLLHEVRGKRAETVTARLVGTSTTFGIPWLVLDDGRRLIPARNVVDIRMAEDVAAEKAALEAEGP